MKKTTWGRALFIMSLLAVSGISQANIQQGTIENLKMNTWLVQTDFHMYTVKSGNNKYLKQLKESIQRGDQTLSTLSSSAETDAGQALVGKLQSQWSKYTRLALKNEVVEQGYPSRYTVQDMEAAGGDIMELLNNADMADQSDYRDVLKLGADLQHMAAVYMKLAASPSGGQVGSDKGLSFEDAVPRFDKQLEKVRSDYADNETMTRTLEQVTTHWQFIRDSLLDFTENSVPFLVYHYSHQITSKLELATQLASSGGATKPMQGGMPTGEGGG